MKTREELLDQLGQLEGYFDELEIFQVLNKNYSADAVDRILAAPTQKQLNCQYCHKEKTINLSETCHLEIASPRDLNLIERRSFDYGDWQTGTTKINYCPMCARKLGDE